MRLLFSSFCILLVVHLVCGLHFTFCPKGIDTFIVDDSHSFDVWFLEAPLFEAVFGRLLGKENLLHNAIGLHNTNTGESWTIEYDAENEVFNATFPYVVTNDNGTRSLSWLNGGGVCITHGINQTFWIHNNTNMATISG